MKKARWWQVDNVAAPQGEHRRSSFDAPRRRDAWALREDTDGLIDDADLFEEAALRDWIERYDRP